MMCDGLVQSTENNNGLKIDPRTKLLLMLLINATVFGCKSLYIMLVMGAIPLFLLFCGHKHKSGLIWTIAYVFAIIATEFLVPITSGVVNLLLVMLSSMLLRLLPGFIMGYYLVMTTTVSEFIASMERMNISRKIIIPLSVMFRFFPTIVEEARAISDAMIMRGISLGSAKFFKNPIAMIEYRLVPLLMSTVKIGEELSAASLTRGLGNPVKRTNLCCIGFGLQDIIISSIAVAAFIGFIMN